MKTELEGKLRLDYGTKIGIKSKNFPELISS